MLINRAYFEDEAVYRALMAQRDAEIAQADKAHGFCWAFDLADGSSVCGYYQEQRP